MPALCAPALLLSALSGISCARSERCRFDLPAVREPAPAPFTSEQIQSAVRVGRRYRFLSVTKPFPPSFTEVEVVAAEHGVYSLHVEHFNVPAWTVGGAATIRQRPRPPATWLDMMGHAAHFDAARTEIVERPCETAFGRLDCLVYTADGTREGGNVVVRSFYAKTLPGPPVLRTVRVCDELVDLVALVQTTDNPAAQ